MTVVAGSAQIRSGSDEALAEMLPPGPGRETVKESCTTCHNLKIIVTARKNRAEWDQCINDMIQRGTALFPEEIEPISAYLVKAFGADVPAAVNVNTARREELQKVPNLNAEVVARIIEERSKSGGFEKAEDLRQALKMEKENFEKFAYLLKYSN